MNRRNGSGGGSGGDDGSDESAVADSSSPSLTIGETFKKYILDLCSGLEKSPFGVFHYF